MRVSMLVSAALLLLSTAAALAVFRPRWPSSGRVRRLPAANLVT
jgi:hypothetical protein